MATEIQETVQEKKRKKKEKKKNNPALLTLASNSNKGNLQA